MKRNMITLLLAATMALSLVACSTPVICTI